jgi:uncharacterized alkaline shock family protein YloU
MKRELEKGVLDISTEVFASICGYAATSCFGVRGMAPASVSDGIVSILKKDNLSHGVRVSSDADGKASIELHIIVRHGINITEICRSIIKEVRYVVENLTGIKVKSVDICVDSIMND